MEYFYSHAVLPDDRSLLFQLEAAAGKLSQKLRQLPLEELGISAYNQKYLSGYIQNVQGTLQLYSYILAWSLADRDVSLDKFVFVDYGGGCGILSLLAKELGVGTVIYNDIYDVSCHDARLIGTALDIESQAYVDGDVEELIAYLNDQGISANAIASYDVIEHIYDIEAYIKKLSSLPSRALKIVFASSANIRNPLINRQRIRSQLAIEHFDRERMWGHKERDSLKSYLSLRKDIIQSYAASLLPEEIEKLAHATRGLIKYDIEQCVLEYQRTGSFSFQQGHPTNTCDPYTGNWAEHLLDHNHIERIFRDQGFTVQIRSGYYDYSARLIPNLIKNLLNKTISVSGSRGLLVAPYYMVCAQGCFFDHGALLPGSSHAM